MDAALNPVEVNNYLAMILIKQLCLFLNPLMAGPYFETRLNVHYLYFDVIQEERTKEDLECIKVRTDLSAEVLK